MRRFTSLGLCALLAIGLAACGGSGGGGPSGPTGMTNADFTGTYGFYLLSGGSGPERFTTAVGAGSADGVGAVSGNATPNINSAVGATIPYDYDYTVGSDGRLVWRVSGGSTELAQGGLSTDGNVAILSVPDSGVGNLPSILAQVRMGSGFGLGSVTGAWHWGRLGYFGSGEVSSIVGTHTFDGTGNYTASIAVYNEDGASPPILALGGTYGVAGDGVIGTSSLTHTMEGQIFPGGNAAILAGGTTNTNIPAFRVLIRKASSAVLGTLSGEYWAVGMEANYAANSFNCFQGTLSANGSGSLSLRRTRNLDGAVTNSDPAIAGTYTVATDGTTNYLLSGNTYRGAVSADGRYGFMGGVVNPGGPPALWLLLRK